MRGAHWILTLGLLLVGGLSSWGQGADWLSLQRRVAEIYEENRDAMVRVKAVYEAGEEEPQIPKLVVGTGFFISNRGLVLTNASIVREQSPAVRVWVEQNGVRYSAEIRGVDRSSNLALLELDETPPKFSFLHLVDSPGLPPVGTFLVRLSMPLEFDPTPEMGLVSGFESRFGRSFFPCKYIRTSLPSVPGDGGAALLDLSGRLVGIQVAAIPEISSTYMLPARAALRVRDDLLFSGEISYGWIGFEVREESSVREGKRIVIAEVIEETPAAEVGLMVEDVLQRIGEFPIHSIDDLRNAVFYSRVGQVVPVEVLREGAPLEFSVRLDKRPASEPLEIIRPVEPAGQPISPLKEKNGDVGKAPTMPWDGGSVLSSLKRKEAETAETE